MKKTIVILILSFLFCTLNAQTKETKEPFYSYFLWYQGTIGEKSITAKVAVKNSTYSVSYAYDFNERWIHFTDIKTDNTIISAKASTEIDNYTDGFIALDMKNLWKLTGQWISQSGEKLPITLKVALKELPNSLKNTTLKNEFTALLLTPTIVADSINVYYSEKNENGKRSPIEIQTYTKTHPNIDNQIIYVDINFDGYLDITIGNAIYIFNTQKQRFEVENSESDFYPGINYISAYEPYNKTFESSHWRTVIWYKAIEGAITPYETEEYNEYDSKDNDHNIGVSENRIRDIDGTEKYSILDLSVKNDSIKDVQTLVEQFIGDRKIEIMARAKLILRYPSGENHHYKYQRNKTWKPLFVEFEGKNIYPVVKKYYDNGQLKSIGFYDEEGNPTGEWKSYNRSGKLRSIGNYKDGHFTGQWEFYSENKQEHTIKNYNRNGKNTGEWKYYRNEKLYQIDYYLDGKMTGEWKSFFKNGQLEYVRYYKNDRAINKHKEYYESGEIKMTISYLDGKKVATNEYYESGKIKMTISYLNGYKVETNKYFESGLLSFSKKVLKNNIVTKSFYKNQQLEYVSRYHKKSRVERFKKHYKNGRLQYKSKQENGRKTGRYKGYHANGKRKAKGEYDNGNKIGVWKLYQENGKLDKIEHWEAGKLIDSKK